MEQVIVTFFNWRMAKFTQLTPHELEHQIETFLRFWFSRGKKSNNILTNYFTSENKAKSFFLWRDLKVARNTKATRENLLQSKRFCFDFSCSNRITRNILAGLFLIKRFQGQTLHFFVFFLFVISVRVCCCDRMSDSDTQNCWLILKSTLENIWGSLSGAIIESSFTFSNIFSHRLDSFLFFYDIVFYDLTRMWTWNKFNLSCDGRKLRKNTKTSIFHSFFFLLLLKILEVFCVEKSFELNENKNFNKIKLLKKASEELFS